MGPKNARKGVPKPWGGLFTVSTAFAPAAPFLAVPTHAASEIELIERQRPTTVDKNWLVLIRPALAGFQPTPDTIGKLFAMLRSVSDVGIIVHI